MQTVIPLEPGIYYHIYNRGVNRTDIFIEERNYAYFMQLYAKYITPVAGQPLPAQPTAALNAIRIFMGPVPAVLLLLSLIFAWRYNVTRESHQALVEELQNRG